MKPFTFIKDSRKIFGETCFFSQCTLLASHSLEIMESFSQDFSKNKTEEQVFQTLKREHQKGWVIFQMVTNDTSNG